MFEDDIHEDGKLVRGVVVLILPVMYFIISAFKVSSSLILLVKRRPSSSKTSTSWAWVCNFLRRFWRDFLDASLFLTRRRSLFLEGLLERFVLVLVRGIGVGGNEYSVAESALMS